MKWAIELNEFNLHFKPCTTLKLQVLADFVAECSLNQIVQEEEDTIRWELHVDGSSNPLGCGVGLILKGLEEHHVQLEYALRFKFQASNNEVEYKALISGIKLAKEVGTKKLKVFSDFQSVVNQTMLIASLKELK